MTDNTSNYAATYAGGVEIVCILDEGNITVSEAFGMNGLTSPTATVASRIMKGEWVSLSDDAAATYAATGGLPIVEKPVAGEDRLFGKIVEEPANFVKLPDASHTSGLADRLANGYYRVAKVWCPFLTAVGEAILVQDGSNAVAPGATTLVFDKSESDGMDTMRLKYASSGGAGFMALTYAAAGSTSGDTVSILVGFPSGLGAVIA